MHDRFINTITGLSTSASYTNGSINTSYNIVTGDFPATAKYGPISASYNSNVSYSINAKYGPINAAYNSNGSYSVSAFDGHVIYNSDGGYSVHGLGMSLHGSNALIVTGIAGGAYGFAGDKIKAWLNEKDQYHFNKVKDWGFNRFKYDISNLNSDIDKMMRSRYRVIY